MWHKIAQDFSMAADSYEQHAHLQQQVIERLTELSRPLMPAESKVLDAGCGTGMLARFRPDIDILGIDIAHGMCQQAQQKFPQVLQGNITQLPLKNEAVDHIFSSLAIQWLEDTAEFFREAFRITNPSGTLVLSTLGTATLEELRQAYRTAGMIPPLMPFHTPESLEESAMAAGWHIMEIKMEDIYTPHDSVPALLKHLKQLGTRHKSLKGIRNVGDMRRLVESYPQKDDRIQARWQAIYLLAEKRV